MWWQIPDAEGVLVTVLGHANTAREKERGTATSRCETYFWAFNVLWNGFAQSTGGEASDTTSFIKLMQSLEPERAAELLNAPEARAVVQFEPSVMDHSVLKKRKYRPGSLLSTELRAEATAKHTELKKRHASWMTCGTDAERVLKTLAELLFIVRSNIAHGEKTPYGPDLEKARRDEQVGSVVIPLQELLLDALLARPSEKLVAYGTLMPGEPNASVLEGLAGEWADCTVRGRLEVGATSLPEFRWDVRGDAVPAKLLLAASLKTAWDRLDRFEGRGYCRHLIPVRIGATCTVANCYVARV